MSKALVITLDLQETTERETHHQGTQLSVDLEIPARGNCEREAVFRAVVAVERAIASLPRGHGQVAGWLHANRFKGDKGAESNAFALYLRKSVTQVLGSESQVLERENEKISISALASGTIVETPRYMVCLEPEPWQAMFFQRLPEFKEICHDS